MEPTFGLCCMSLFDKLLHRREPLLPVLLQLLHTNLGDRVCLSDEVIPHQRKRLLLRFDVTELLDEGVVRLPYVKQTRGFLRVKWRSLLLLAFRLLLLELSEDLAEFLGQRSSVNRRRRWSLWHFVGLWVSRRDVVRDDRVTIEVYWTEEVRYGASATTIIGWLPKLHISFNHMLIANRLLAFQITNSDELVLEGGLSVLKESDRPGEFLSPAIKF